MRWIRLARWRNAIISARATPRPREDQDQSVDPAARHAAETALRETPPGELAARRAELQAAASAAGLSPGDVQEILNSRGDLPRPLLPEERAVLVAVLAHHDFDGRDALLAQVDAAHVVGYCGCGCASVSLSVERSSPAAPGRTRSPLPNEATVLNADGEGIGDVIVFHDDGYLSYLEVSSFGFDEISPFPSLDHLEPHRG